MILKRNDLCNTLEYAFIDFRCLILFSFQINVYGPYNHFDSFISDDTGFCFL
jgi:hypothetical protein